MRLAATAAVATVSVLVPWRFAPVASAAPIDVTFEFTGGPEEFLVPPDVCRVHVEALGASGGDRRSLAGEEFPGVGGYGAYAIADLEVTPGEALTVRVGGEGGDAVQKNVLEGEPNALPGGAGGFNGGADGGTIVGGAFATGGRGTGAGGGGASDVRRAGPGPDTRVVIAAGGGGTGAGDQFGGDGRWHEGQQGGDGNGFPKGGGGGTDVAGGAPGQDDTGFVTAGGGTLGTGGHGASTMNDGFGLAVFAGGGGGGGLHGGGGGGAAALDNAPGGGGGGGSSLVPPGGFVEAGVRNGDGQVVITYEQEPGCADAPDPDPDHDFCKPISQPPTVLGPDAPDDDTGDCLPPSVDGDATCDDLVVEVTNPNDTEDLVVDVYVNGALEADDLEVPSQTTVPVPVPGPWNGPITVEVFDPDGDPLLVSTTVLPLDDCDTDIPDDPPSGSLVVSSTCTTETDAVFAISYTNTGKGATVVDVRLDGQVLPNGDDLLVAPGATVKRAVEKPNAGAVFDVVDTATGDVLASAKVAAADAVPCAPPAVGKGGQPRYTG
jgi:hypothetical protein